MTNTNWVINLETEESEYEEEECMFLCDEYQYSKCEILSLMHFSTLQYMGCALFKHVLLEIVHADGDELPN